MPLQATPLRIPDTWSATWFRRFVVEVLSKADVRNALGIGITITSDGDSVATLSTDAETAGAISAHNADPFAHPDVINAHKAESNPHPLYGQIEDYAFFVGE